MTQLRHDDTQLRREMTQLRVILSESLESAVTRDENLKKEAEKESNIGQQSAQIISRLRSENES